MELWRNLSGFSLKASKSSTFLTLNRENKAWHRMKAPTVWKINVQILLLNIKPDTRVTYIWRTRWQIDSNKLRIHIIPRSYPTIQLQLVQENRWNMWKALSENFDEFLFRLSKQNKPPLNKVINKFQKHLAFHNELQETVWKRTATLLVWPRLLAYWHPCKTILILRANTWMLLKIIQQN